MRLHSTTDYVLDRYSFLRRVEGFELTAYVDSVGVPTIGVGIHLNVHQNLVLQRLGFDLSGTALTGAAAAAEQSYIQQIRDVLALPYAPGPTGTANLRANLAPIMTARAQNSVYAGTFARRASFALVDDSESRTLVNNDLMLGYNVPGTNFPGYEAILDQWLTANGINTTVPGLMSRDSRERMALISYTWQGWVKENQSGSSPMLARALANDDRAEAWYEIRYNTNVEARRFLEADTFDLYDSGPLGEADYKAAYRVLTRHRTKIFGADSIAGTSDDYEQVNQRRLNNAVTWGNSLNIAVRTINGHLARAQEYIAATYGVGIPVDWSNIFVGEDQTTLYFKGTDVDALNGTAQSDLIFGESGNDFLLGGRGDDVLYGGADNDTYVYNTGDGFDTIIDSDGSGQVQIDGLTVSSGFRAADGLYISNDERFVFGFDGDLVTGGTLTINGDVRVEGFKNGDLGISLQNTSNLSLIQPTSNTLVETQGISGATDGNDLYLISPTELVAYFFSRGGDDLSQPAPEQHSTSQVGDSGDDILFGGAGIVDSLWGGAGRDVLYGGEGTDNLVGDYQSAVFYRNGEFGAPDLDFNLYYNAFGSGAAYGFQYTGTRDPLDFYDISIGGYYLNDPLGPRITFSGGWEEALRYVLGIGPATDLSTLYDDVLDGGPGDDRVFGGPGSDNIMGGDGNDTLYGDNGGLTQVTIAQPDITPEQTATIRELLGKPGDDYLDGGRGNDFISDAEGGNDILIGGDGADLLTSEDPADATIAFNNYLSGGDGNDSLFSFNRSPNGFDTLFGGAGNDTLEAGIGSAYAEGGAGSDRYWVVHSLAPAQLLVNNHDDTVGKTDRLELASTTLPLSDLATFTRDEANLYLGFGGISDRITIQNWFLDSSYKIEQIVFTNSLGFLGSPARIYDIAAVEALFATATAGADFLWGIAGSDQILALAGNDTVVGNAGDDTLDGGDGDDRLIGSAGSDVLIGGVGNDTYAFHLGDGIDRILDTAGTDTVAFGPDITPADITLGLGSLLVRVGDGSDAIHIEGFNPDDALNSGAIEVFQFAGGINLTYGELLARGFDISGTAGDDTLSGTNLEDRISGFEGNDAISSGQADDTLDGGAGNDVLAGGPGDDAYLFGFGSGQDVIEDLDTTGLDTDTVRVGAGVAPADIAVTRAGDFITLAINGTSDQLSIRWQPQAGYQVERVEFANGTLWDAATLESMVTTGGGNTAPTLASAIADQPAPEDSVFSFTVPADTFADADAGDTLTYSAALANDDPLPLWLTFNGATRTFSGTPTNDEVGTVGLKVTATDSGNLSAFDTFDLTVANTNDAPMLAQPLADLTTTERQAFSFVVPANTFTDVDAGDALAYTAALANGGALPSWLAFNPLTWTFSGTPGEYDIGTSSIRVAATDQAGAQAADEFNLSVALLSGVTLTGTSGQDILVGGAGADTLSGLAGADKLYGNEGQDVLNGGDGADELFGWTGNDTLYGGAGADTMFGDEGADTLYGELGADVLWGGAGNDTLNGGDGGDTLRGETGDDLLYGEDGADVIYGGTGNDYLSGGLGGDQLSGEDGNDVAQGGDGADTLLGQAGNDLLQARLGGDTLDGDGGNDFLAAGGGADTIKPGAGQDVIAFNRGDGSDTVQATGGPEDTLSIGGGVRYQDLTLSKSSNNLVLDAGGGDKLTFKDWYAATPVHSVLNLQVIAEAMADFNPASTDPLLNRKVQSFDFQGIYGAFEAARAANPALTSWALTNALLDFHLSGSDTEALGGDLAYQYGKNGALTGIALNAAQDILGSPQFGVQAQALRPLASLQEGLVKLS